jgi:serine-type D-Ala-D-Ala carboxypeptidase/endopeptidase
MPVSRHSRRVEVEKRAVGMAVCRVRPGHTHFVTWGRARLGDERPITPDTVFEIDSITKVFTALLLADMVRQGEVALDDSVARYLPGDFRLPVLDGRQMPLAAIVHFLARCYGTV